MAKAVRGAGTQSETPTVGFPSRIVLAGLLALVPAMAAAQSPDAGAGLYRLGLGLIEEGRFEQGLERLEESVRVAPEGPWADDALLAVARYHYPPRDLSQLGDVPADSIAKALQALGRLRERYPLSDSIPSATYSLGLIAMDPVNPKRSLDEAYGHFATILGLYPDSTEAAPSAYAAARCSFSQGIVDDAVVMLLRLLEEYPSSPLEDRARFMLSDLLDRSGDSTRAIQELQILRETTPSSPLAPDALMRATLLYRLRKLATGEAFSARPPWKRDDAWLGPTPEQGMRSPIAIAVTPDGSLVAADEKADAVLIVNPEGALLESRPWERPQDVAVGADGKIFVSGARVVAPLGGAAVAPARGPVSGEREPERVRRVGGIAVGPGGGVFLVDSSAPAVIEYGQDLSFRSVLQNSGAGDITGLAIGPDGEIWFGLEKTNDIVRLDFRGRESARVTGSEAGIESIRDLVIDEAGNIYVLDDRSRTIRIFDRSAHPVTVVGMDDLGLGGVTLTAIAVDRSGRLYLADRKAPRIWRLE